MTKLPGAKPSPRIAGGVLRWYAGDTFSVTLALERCIRFSLTA